MKTLSTFALAAALAFATGCAQDQAEPGNTKPADTPAKTDTTAKKDMPEMGGAPAKTSEIVLAVDGMM